jgi:streptogramin lyase
MAYGFGSLWVLGEKVERLSPTTMRRIATIDRAGGLGDIATGAGSVWVTNDESGAVARINPQQEAVLRTYDVGGQPFGVAVGASGVWVASDTGAVARIDPVTDEVETVAVGGAPRDVALTPFGVWISVD